MTYFFLTLMNCIDVLLQLVDLDGRKSALLTLELGTLPVDLSLMLLD